MPATCNIEIELISEMSYEIFRSQVRPKIAILNTLIRANVI